MKKDMTAFGHIQATLVHRYAGIGESRIDAKKDPPFSGSVF
jgi:hypothetical protein